MFFLHPHEEAGGGEDIGGLSKLFDTQIVYFYFLTFLISSFKSP